MENTCVLDILPVIPEWKVYNIPSKKEVQYCYILQQKKEFQGLLKNILSEEVVFSKACSVVDKKFKTFESKPSVEVIFLNQTEASHSICLKLYINEKYILRRRNNILVFLKNHNGIKITYQVHENNIFVRSHTQLYWDIYYKLYKFLLIKYEITVIGAAFYNSLVSKYLLENEKMFLQLKTANVEKDIEVPKTLSGVSLKTNNSLRNKENIPVLLPRQNFIPKVSNISSKRKNMLEDTILASSQRKLKYCKLNVCSCAKLGCQCHQAEWKQFRELKKVSINSYLDILLARNVFAESDISFSQESKNSTSIHETISKLDSPVQHNNKDVDKQLKVSQEKVSSESLDKTFHDNEQEMCILADDQDFDKEVEVLETLNLPSEIPLKSNTSFDAPQEENLKELSVCPSKIKNSSENLDCEQSGVNSKINSPTNKLKPAPSNIDEHEISALFEDFAEPTLNKDSTAPTFGMFQTASGKKVNISETALKAAEKMLAETSKDAGCNKRRTFPVRNPSKSKAQEVLPLVEEGIDRDLVDKIFEEVSFDDKELENKCSTAMTANVDASVNRTFGKVRKSLGGRRSLKPYSSVLK